MIVNVPDELSILAIDIIDNESIGDDVSSNDLGFEVAACVIKLSVAYKTLAGFLEATFPPDFKSYCSEDVSPEGTSHAHGKGVM